MARLIRAASTRSLLRLADKRFCLFSGVQVDDVSFLVEYLQSRNSS